VLDTAEAAIDQDCLGSWDYRCDDLLDANGKLSFHLAAKIPRFVAPVELETAVERERSLVGNTCVAILAREWSEFEA